jgi:hypothetical protein
MKKPLNLNNLSLNKKLKRSQKSKIKNKIEDHNINSNNTNSKKIIKRGQNLSYLKRVINKDHKINMKSPKKAVKIIKEEKRSRLLEMTLIVKPNCLSRLLVNIKIRSRHNGKLKILASLLMNFQVKAAFPKLKFLTIKLYQLLKPKIYLLLLLELVLTFRKLQKILRIFQEKRLVNGKETNSIPNS